MNHKPSQSVEEERIIDKGYNGKEKSVTGVYLRGNF